MTEPTLAEAVKWIREIPAPGMFTERDRQMVLIVLAALTRQSAREAELTALLDEAAEVVEPFAGLGRAGPTDIHRGDPSRGGVHVTTEHFRAAVRLSAKFKSRPVVANSEGGRDADPYISWLSRLFRSAANPNPQLRLAFRPRRLRRCTEQSG